MQKINAKKLYRIMDANFNRAKEGLRVCEDICRFVYDQRGLTQKYKAIRHELSGHIARLGFKDILQARNIGHDVGKTTTALELKRKSVKDVLYANSQRVKESIRVLEEFAKLLNTRLALRLKGLRYRLYAIEKEVIRET